MAKKKKDRFPVRIFVTIDGDGRGDEWLSANESAESAEDGQLVAVYKLEVVRTKRVTHGLQ